MRRAIGCGDRSADGSAEWRRAAGRSAPMRSRSNEHVAANELARGRRCVTLERSSWPIPPPAAVPADRHERRTDVSHGKPGQVRLRAVDPPMAAAVDGERSVARRTGPRGSPALVRPGAWRRDRAEAARALTAVGPLEGECGGRPARPIDGSCRGDRVDGVDARARRPEHDDPVGADPPGRRSGLSPGPAACSRGTCRRILRRSSTIAPTTSVRRRSAAVGRSAHDAQPRATSARPGAAEHRRRSRESPAGRRQGGRRADGERSPDRPAWTNIGARLRRCSAGASRAVAETPARRCRARPRRRAASGT